MQWCGCILWCWCGMTLAPAGTGTASLTWDRMNGRVSANLERVRLLDLLEDIAGQSGWQVFVEPDETFRASAKFENLPPGEALRRMLGALNYAMVPQPDGGQRLYVFRTTLQHAVQSVQHGKSAKRPEARKVPKELILRLQAGADVEALAKLLGGKVVGAIPELAAYRLQFADEASTEAARQKLAGNPEVTSVEDNYFVDLPQVPQPLAGGGVPALRLSLAPPPADGKNVVVGLVDTALQPLGPLEPFVKERLSVAGESQPDSGLPTHATAMANALYQAIGESGRRSTSVPIISVDVFGPTGSANTFNVAWGLITAGNKGANLINASLGGYGDSPVLRDAVQQLARHGIPIFAAMGNDASLVPFYPAAYPEVVAVTALQPRGGGVAPYANKGTTADLAAPGLVLFGYNGGYFGSQGTSVSSAMAAGMAAGMAEVTRDPWSKIISSLETTWAAPRVGN